jgi:hypothetical protein
LKNDLVHESHLNEEHHRRKRPLGRTSWKDTFFSQKKARSHRALCGLFSAGQTASCCNRRRRRRWPLGNHQARGIPLVRLAERRSDLFASGCLEDSAVSIRADPWPLSPSSLSLLVYPR